MAATRTTPSQKVSALLAKTVANGCTRPEMIAAQETARAICEKHKLDIRTFVWPEVPEEAKQAAEPKRKRAPKTAMVWPPKEGMKAHRVWVAVQQKDGATAAELLELTGWLPHSLRGWVSNANKVGANITSSRADGVTRYRSA